MYSTFAQSSRIDVTGLLYSLGRVIPSVVRMSGSRKIDRDGTSSLLLNDMSTNRSVSLSGLRSPTQAARVMLYLKHVLAGRPQVWDIPTDVLGDSLWRLLFSKSLPESDRPVVQRGHFVGTSFSLSQIIDQTTLLRARGPVKLPTNGYDFVVFHDSRRIQVSRGSQKLIRYHDAIPITQPDTMDRRYSALHLRALRDCAADSFYVCNSEPVREELVRLEPRLESRSIAIPYRIERRADEATPRDIPVTDIALSRISFMALADASSRITEAVESKIRQGATGGEKPEYILAVSTLEPRKNYANLIRAWEQVVARSRRDLKLIIVANPGWRFESIIPAMKPRVAAGDLWHLQNLTSAELQSLYRQAACVVFPSFAEGFGFPPIEAMMQGTPAVVSDLPVHRWVMQDAVLYADPYNVQMLAEQIERLIYGPEADGLRAELRRNAERVLARYDRQAIEDQWCSLFDDLKAKRPA